jgi:hypothetical protein
VGWFQQAIKFVFVHREVKNRRLGYGETVSPCPELMHSRFTLRILADTAIFIVGSPTVMPPFIGDPAPDVFHAMTEKLMSDPLLPFAKTN